NAARNIAKRIGYNTPIPRKILTYMVTTNGVKPLTPKEGVTVETPTVKTPPKKGEEGGHQGLHLTTIRKPHDTYGVVQVTS
ncbi:MAG: hypothetical protein RXR39_01485, partial [Caldivirga sp.]